MKRIGCIVLLSALAAIPLAPAAAQDLLWMRQAGTPENDSGSDVAVDSAGNAYIAGTTGGSLFGQSAGGNDFFLAKYDASGAKLWTRQAGTTEDDAVNGVAVDSAGNAYITGATSGSLFGQSAGGYDVFLAKYDPSGTLLWTRQNGTSEDDYGSGVAVDSAGNAYMSGYTSDRNLPPGDTDAFLTKYDASGVLLWTRQIRTFMDDYGSDVAVDSAGNAYITGTTRGSLGGPSAGANDAFLAKYDASGVLLWTRQIGTNGEDSGRDVAVDSTGSAFITGSTQGSLGGPNAGREDAFLAKYDASGTLLWTRQFGTSMYDYGSGVAVDSAGNVYISGLTWGSLFGPNIGKYDIFLAKYDASGTLLWTHQTGTSANDIGTGVAVDTAGNAYVSGQTEGSLGRPNAGGKDIFLAKYGQAPCYADCDQSTGNGVLDIFDFLCFQDAYVAGCASIGLSHRMSDWRPGGAHGTTLGNPSPDLQGRLVWSYEWVTGGPLYSPNPWYAQATQRSTWDEDWFGSGQGAWSRADDTNPPIFHNRLTHNITASTWSDIPMVRWLNPAGDETVINLAGTLTVKWSGEGGVGSPVDVDIVVAKYIASQETWNVLASITVSKPIPQPSIGDEIVLPLSREGIVLDKGDSIIISHRAVSDSGSTGRWIVLTDDLTFTGPPVECYADCDDSGTLDIFDFLCFQNAFVAGCP